METSRANDRLLAGRSLRSLGLRHGVNSLLVEIETGVTLESITEPSLSELNVACRTSVTLGQLTVPRARRLGSRDRLPRLGWLMQVILLVLLDNSEGRGQLSIGHDVEPPVHLLLSVLMRNTLEGHVLQSVELCKRLLASSLLDVEAHLEALLFVFVSDVLLEKASLVFDLHVDWVVHKTITAQLQSQPLTSKQ